MPKRRKKRGNKIKIDQSLFEFARENDYFETKNNIKKSISDNNSDEFKEVGSVKNYDEISEEDFQDIINKTKCSSIVDFELEEKRFIDEVIIQINHKELNQKLKADNFEPKNKISELRELLLSCEDESVKKLIEEEIKLNTETKSDENYSYDSDSDVEYKYESDSEDD